VQGIVLALAMPIGMLIFGPLADVISIEAITIAAGAAMILVSALVARGAPTAYAPGR
jgi:DHA3 family macrolide efflux protein-like MFS transporter